MKHFIATHTFHTNILKRKFFSERKNRKKNSDWFGNESEEHKRIFLNLLHNRNVIDENNFEKLNSDDFAIPMQFFIGKGDFFFCHWMAIDEQSIIDRLSSVGSDEYFITLVTNIDKPKINVEAILPLINKLN